MNVADLLNAPWAVAPAMYSTIQDVGSRHLAGERLTDAEIAAKLGGLPGTTRPGMTTERGVAIIPVEGVLGPKLNMLSAISGGTSYQLIGQQFAEALADPSARAILLNIDSPGGTVQGVQSLADAIYAASGRKPIVAHTDGTCCSAALWLASACDSLTIGGDTTAVGSIGILATHVDSSGADAARGLKRTLISSVPAKVAGSPHAPLDAEGAKAIAAQVAHLHNVFASTIGRNRKLIGQELAAATTGETFLGRNAIAVGLADGVATLDSVVARLGAESPAAVTARAPQPTTADDIGLAVRRRIAAERVAGRTMSTLQAFAEVSRRVE